jgi:hypothetical protein
MTRQGQHEHFRAGTMEEIEVAFEWPVNDDIAGADAMATGIARLVVASSQNHCGKRLTMAVPR